MSGEYRNPSLTVDIIIRFQDGAVALIQRLNPPFKDQWALPGGFVDYGETVECAAVREAREETGIEVELVRLVGVYSDPDRDPRGHTVSVVFAADPVGGVFAAADDAKSVMKTTDFLEKDLAFDHNRIMLDAREQGLI